MVAASEIPPGEYVPTADQRVVMYGVSWEHYEAILAAKGDAPVPRIFYLDGAMELMSPSRGHERNKSFIGMLVEAYALETNIDLSPYGSWTLKKRKKKSGAEPDECYIIGSDRPRDRPDIAIEVVGRAAGSTSLRSIGACKCRRSGSGRTTGFRSTHLRTTTM
jgi:Uma2 family endonuclease